MSRHSLEDRILWCKRELQALEATVTNCESCNHKKYARPECIKHGPVPFEFLSRTDCPDWEFSEIPF
jgi:hypothetical protein